MSRTLNTVPKLLKRDLAVFQSLFNLYFGQVTELKRNNGYMDSSHILKPMRDESGNW